MRNWIVLLLSLLLLAACAKKQHPEYLLTDSKLRTFHGGDSNTYSVLDADSNSDKLDLYTESLQTEQPYLPDGNKDTVLAENYTRSGNLVNPFTNRLFKQDKDGNLLILGVSYAGNNYWIVDGQNIGKVFLPANLSDLSNGITIDSDLTECSDTNCQTTPSQTPGHLKISLSLKGTETVDTKYATFESYKISIDWELQLYPTNATNSIYQVLNGAGSTQWIHPAIGVVKYNYQIQTSTQSATLIGTLTSTSISIPDRYKK